MMISEVKYHGLVSLGVLPEEELFSAAEAAAARGIELERMLLREKGVRRKVLLQALSLHYGLPHIEYDERLPVPRELLSGLDGERLSYSKWFPVIRDGDTVVIAANDPADPVVKDEVVRYFRGYRHEFMVALAEDIQWFISDFLNARPGQIIGTERTGLAYWRNTMALWRTRLSCYRTDLAKARTSLAALRSGLGLIAISDALTRLQALGGLHNYYWLLLVPGALAAAYGLMGYLKIRRSRMKPPGHHTLVEVTAATI